MDTLQTHHIPQDTATPFKTLAFCSKICYKAELALLYFVEGELQAKMGESGEAHKIFKSTFVEMTFL